MCNLLDNLPEKERRGSKPRCHMLTDGDPDQVAARLTDLIAPWGTVSEGDVWMPRGFCDTEEAQLDKAPHLSSKAVCRDLQSWWLAVRPATTPNWDIASTCRIEGKKGLLLVEAKAHDKELIGEEGGKKLDDDASENSRKNHDHIGAAITQANTALNAAVPGWKLSRDSHYQMSNRFAWSWKLTERGFPVILVYLGFRYAVDVDDLGKLFVDHADWQNLVMAHSEPLFPYYIWEHKWALNEQVFIPLIRSI